MIGAPLVRSRIADIVPHRLSGAAWAGRRVGLLGGSFNPAHAGHRYVSLVALRLLRLDQVWWLVSPQNPLKPATDMATLTERTGLARRAANHPRLIVSNLETELGTRYTADTLAGLDRYFPRTRFVWLIGADNLIQMRRWQNWHRIFERFPVAVFSRPPYSLHALADLAARRYRNRRINQRDSGRLAEQKTPSWVFFRNPWHPASATAIRRRNGAGALPTHGPIPGRSAGGQPKSGQPEKAKQR